MLLQPWKSYNCYNAAAGSVLQAGGYPFIALALNSSWDFYLDLSHSGNISMAGVFNATEHPAVAMNLGRIYGLGITELICPDWGSCLSLLSDKLGEGARPMIRLKNKFCDYIPKVEMTGILDHYLIATSLDEDRFGFFDSFLNHHGHFPPNRLKEILEGFMEPGQGPGYTVWIISGAPGNTASADIRSILKDVFFTTLSKEAFARGDEGYINCNEDAIKQLGDFIMNGSPGRFGESALQCLSESLRYVQYQRKYFISSLEEIGSYFPDCREEAAAISGRVNALSDDWFRLRLNILYKLRRGGAGGSGRKGWVGDLAKELADGLYSISGKERTLKTEISRFKDHIINSPDQHAFTMG
jgi:hypothetical protein